MVVTDARTQSVRAWLAEDVGAGDATTDALIPAGRRCGAVLRLKEPGVVAGLRWAEETFRELDPDLVWTALVGDGDTVQPCELARLEGRARAILTGERLALNLLGRLSGIATLTRRFVDAVEGTGAAILDTRKTTPGLRALEKEAVRLGGGTNHRFGLDDAVLVKDNHLALAPGIGAAVAAVRPSGLVVEVECESLQQVREALEAGVDRVLLDNMTPAQLAEAVRLVAGRAATEASGGVTLETVRSVAGSGVDFISVGALTHAARSLDVSLEVLP
jgi:nicotinate-nucleotide pyrophosphorylase (carboxylating)